MVDWILLGTDESSKGWKFWEPYHAACLQAHLASWQESRVIMIIITMILEQGERNIIDAWIGGWRWCS